MSFVCEFSVTWVMSVNKLIFTEGVYIKQRSADVQPARDAEEEEL